jgi:ubiquinone/menaquinone biosynthesis C-methylase UbiE
MKALFKGVYRRFRRGLAALKGSASYWSVHMVNHETFLNAQESLQHFHWRNAQYPGYIELMPVSGQDNKFVLDYGCGPGNDLVGFSVYSNPSKLYGVDVSQAALEKAEQRLLLHNKKPELIQIDEALNTIPIPSSSVDFIHTSGVLHHCADLNKVLKEFERILKPCGELAVMVYNYQSIWLHLYVAWIRQLNLCKYQGLPVLEAFRRTTDGTSCPIAHCYKPDDFLELVSSHGFSGIYKGAAISLTEMKCIERRFDAIQDRRLAIEHRDFLSTLTFDKHGIPIHGNSVAGIDACYLFRKTK